MKRIQISCFGLVLVLGLVSAAPLAVANQAGEDADPVLGNWRLVVEKSNYGRLPPPRSERRTYTPHPAGLQTTIVRIDAAGAIHTISYVSDYDSVEYPVVGAAAADTIIWLPIDERISPNTAQATAKHGDSVMATVRRTLSDDGRTMTISVLRAETGQTEIRVYERED